MANTYLGMAELTLSDHEPAAPTPSAQNDYFLIHRGEDHRAAADLFAEATPDGRRLAATFKRLIDLKDEAHYGVTLLSSTKARNAVGSAKILVSRANEKLED